MPVPPIPTSDQSLEKQVTEKKGRGGGGGSAGTGGVEGPPEEAPAPLAQALAFGSEMPGAQPTFPSSRQTAAWALNLRVSISPPLKSEVGADLTQEFYDGDYILIFK